MRAVATSSGGLSQSPTWGGKEKVDFSCWRPLFDKRASETAEKFCALKEWSLARPVFDFDIIRFDIIMKYDAQIKHMRHK